MLEIKDAIKVETIQYGRSKRNNKLRSQKVYFFKCHCGAEIRSQRSHLKIHSGKCTKCAQFNEPFKSTYNELLKSSIRRGIEVSISYEDFLEFTKIHNCHYCGNKITWHPHTKRNSKDVKGSRAYKLDRMNNDIGYHKNNCVVCCKRCNEAKSNEYTYEEWFGMTKYFRDLKL
jgi:hypothetical protein